MSEADGRPFQPSAFKDYVDRNEIDVLHFYSAYPAATTRDVSQAIAIGDRTRLGADPRLAALVLGPEPPAQGRLAQLRDTAAVWWRNLTGRNGVRPLTIALPIDPQDGEALTQDLCALSPDSSPLARVGDTHFARFALLPPDLKALDQPQPDRLECPYLLFTANYDGPKRAYLSEPWRRTCMPTASASGVRAAATRDQATHGRSRIGSAVTRSGRTTS